MQQNCSSCTFLYLLCMASAGLEEEECSYGMATTGPSETRPFKPIGAGPKQCRPPIACHLLCLLMVHPCFDVTQAASEFKIGTVSLAHLICLVSCLASPSAVILLLLNISAAGFLRSNLSLGSGIVQCGLSV